MFFGRFSQVSKHFWLNHAKNSKIQPEASLKQGGRSAQIILDVKGGQCRQCRGMKAVVSVGRTHHTACH